MKRGKSLLFVLVLGWVMTACANPTPTRLGPTATSVPAALSPLPTPTVAIPPTMAPTATAEPTATLPPSPLETPTRFQRPTPGPTTTPFPGTPLDFETISQGDALSAVSQEDYRWPPRPMFFVIANLTEWEEFLATHQPSPPRLAPREIFQRISNEFDFVNNLLIIGVKHVNALNPQTNHRVLSVSQDNQGVYIRIVWEELTDVSLFAEGTSYLMARIRKPGIFREATFTFVSQWSPYYDGTFEDVAVVTRSLP